MALPYIEQQCSLLIAKCRPLVSAPELRVSLKLCVYAMKIFRSALASVTPYASQNYAARPRVARDLGVRETQKNQNKG